MGASFVSFLGLRFFRVWCEWLQESFGFSVLAVVVDFFQICVGHIMSRN